MTKGGTPLSVVKKALGHQDLSTTLIYTRSEDAELRRALEVTATRMLEAGGAKTTAL
jgi:site-specific recombinase XerD